MSLPKTVCIAASVAIVLSASAVAGTTPQGTAFTYQGRLKHAGTPVTGSADLRFSLWDASSGGTQVSGLPIPIDNVTLAEGVFTVALDFPVALFDGNARWLQVAVRSPAGSGSFTTLAPRQLLTATPYALQTRGMFVDNGGNVGIGTTLPGARLDVAGAARFSGVAPYALSMYNGTSSTLDIGIAGGTGHYSTSAVLNDVILRNIASGKSIHLQNGSGAAALTITGNNRVGIGTTGPQARLHVSTGFSEALDGIQGAAMISGYAGVRGSSYATTDGAGVWGYDGSFNGLSFGVKGESFSFLGTGVRGVALLRGGTNYGVSGSSNSPDGFDFYADGAGMNYGASSSIRWKRDITPIDDPLAKLAAMRGVHFNWDVAHGGHHDVGMIAEEVGAVLPEIVNYEANGIDAIGMDYSKLTPLLVEAVKTLRAEKDAEIAALRAEKDAELADLRARLAALEAAVQRLQRR